MVEDMRGRGEVARARLAAVFAAGVLVAGGSFGASAQHPPAPAGQATLEPVAAEDRAGEHRADENGPSEDAAAEDTAAEDTPAEDTAAEDTAAENGPAGDPTTENPAGQSAADPQPGAPPGHPEVVVPYRVRVATSNTPAAEFAATVHRVLTDPRGWLRAGFRFVGDADAPYTIVLAEGDEVDRLCHPYDTAGAYSCQNGPVVAINADRWRAATPEWPGTLAGYRTMLINHEVGHLLHLHHPDPQCPGPGLPSPVMAQQSSGPEPCLPHSWPLQWEIDLAAERRERLAPPAHHDVSDHRPAPPPARS